MPRKSFPAALKSAFPHTVPILTGYLAEGLAYGLLMASKGYNFLWSGFVSAFAFCGSMQYVAITLLTTAFDPLSAFFLSLMVNARHLFFSLALPQLSNFARLQCAGGRLPVLTNFCLELPDVAVLGGVLYAGRPHRRPHHL